MDSNAIRNVTRNIRDRENRQMVNMVFIRKLIAGVGKCIGSRIENSYEYIEKLRIQRKSVKVEKILKLCKK